MRKHAVLIALILGIAFLVYKFETMSVNPKPRPAALDEGEPVAPQPRPTIPKNDHAAAARVALGMPTTEPDEADSKCWDAINDQLRTNRYIETIRPKLDATVGAWFYDEENKQTTAEETSDAGRFFQALAEAGLLEGRSLDENPAHSLQLLKAVAEDDRTNSAPLVYAAWIEEKRGHPEEAQRLMAEAKLRPSFNSYVLDFNRTVFKDMKTPDDWFEAIAVTSRTPIPQMVGLSAFLKAQNATEVASAMVRNYPADGKAPLFDIDWFALEYQVGHGTLTALDPQQASLYPKFRDVLHEGALRAEARPASDFFQRPSKYACDTHALEPLVEEIKERLSSVKSPR